MQRLFYVDFGGSHPTGSEVKIKKADNPIYKINPDHIGGYQAAIPLFSGIETKFGLCLPRFSRPPTSGGSWCVEQLWEFRETYKFLLLANKTIQFLKVLSKYFKNNQTMLLEVKSKPVYSKYFLRSKPKIIFIVKQRIINITQISDL